MKVLIVKKTITYSKCVLVGVILILHVASDINAQNWKCEILPSERKVEIDPQSKAEITFITTSKSNDTNLYFHDRCWLPGGDIMLFNSDRTGRNEIFGYVAETGELVRFDSQDDEAAKFPLASKFKNVIYVMRENSIYSWKITVQTEGETIVEVYEEKICDYPDDVVHLHGLNENSDGTFLSFGYSSKEHYYIAIVEIETGLSEVVTKVDYPVQHIQFSWNRPDMLSYARSYGSDTAPTDPTEEPRARIWFLNIKTKIPMPAFYQVPGELVTHECWWVNDQITFIGGHRREEGHVKVFNLINNEIRVVGTGAWMENVEAKELSKYNWWHAAGSPDGRWVVADNWHGNIALFDAKTTRMRLLTTGHRVYGSGAHPHAGWDLEGRSVEFTSNKLGNPDVCIVKIPLKWQ